MLTSLAESGFRLVFGRITAITDDTLLYAGVGPAPYDLVLPFSPRVLQGYEGQSLERLGAQVGALVHLRWNPASGHVGAAEILSA
jgi:hypothetical protein